MDKGTYYKPGGDQQSSFLPMIYILGNSHSGSTLLSFLLSYHPDNINLGELKSRTWLKTRNCSCGRPVDTCPFYENYFTEFNALKVAATGKMRTRNPIHFVFRKKIRPDAEEISALRSFYATVSQRVKNLYPDAAHIVDSSKSLWLLNAWLYTLPGHDVKIIWIRRNLSANVASFVKRGSPFMSSLLTLMANTWLMKLYLRRNKLDYLEVNYDHFYDAYPSEARRISAYLGQEIPTVNSGYPNHHVISGNNKTRQAFSNQFTGIHKDDEWQRILSDRQKKILSWLS